LNLICTRNGSKRPQTIWPFIFSFTLFGGKVAPKIPIMNV
jgi:hypothetical protein